MRKAWGNAINSLASLKLTAALLGLLLAVLALYAREIVENEWPRIAILTALTANLLANMSLRPRLLRRPPLALFHLCLLAILLLSVGGRLVYYQAALQAAEGQRVKLSGVPSHHGPWAPARLMDLSIKPLRIETLYWYGDNPKSSDMEVELSYKNQLLVRGKVAPNEPLVHEGVRIYLSPTQGFAAIFSYSPSTGEDISRGAIYFPEYRKLSQLQIQQMTVPGLGYQLNCTLNLTDLFSDQHAWGLEAPAGTTIRISSDGEDTDATLPVGGSLELPSGELRLESIVRYARITVDYDPTASWILLLLMLCPAPLLWQYMGLGKLHRQSARTGSSRQRGAAGHANDTGSVNAAGSTSRAARTKQ